MKKTLLILLAFLSFGFAEAQALVCPDATEPLGTDWCDEDPSRYINDTLCLVEPIESGGDVDQEVVGAGVCILGKFKEPTDIHNLVDMVVSYSFLTDPLLGPSGLFVPELQVLEGTGEFMTTFPLADEGLYDVSVQVRLVDDVGSYQDIPASRSVLRLSRPDLTIIRARIAGSDDSCATPSENCLNVQDTSDQYDDVDPGIAPDRGIGVSPGVGEGAVSGRSIEFCVSTEEEATTGDQVTVTAFNTITNSEVDPVKELTLEKSCLAPEATACQQDSSDFCPEGYVVDVPVGHGENKLELFVNNPVTGSGFESGEWISVDPFDVDLKGPELCVTYLNEDELPIDNADGNVILTSEAERVIVDVALGPCDEEPEAVSLPAPENCNVADPPACEDNALCLQKNNDAADGEDTLVALCETTGGDGFIHYQADLGTLRYPVNTFKLITEDNLGNRTVETHSFGYGNVRSLFNADGEFQLREAIIPNGVGGFVPADFVTGKIQDLILKAVNTDKFRDEIFLELLEPRQPVNSEIACLNDLEGQQIVEENGLKCSFDHLASKDRVVTFKLFESTGIGEIQIPSFYFLNNNKVWLQLKIMGFRGRGEMYTIQFRDSDGDGEVDTEDSDDDNDGIEDEDDPDDDNDGVLDERDLPGRIVPDPDFGFYIVPIRLAVKELAINIEMTLGKDEDGKLTAAIDAVPGRDLIEAIPDNDFLIELDCEKDISEVFQGGTADEPGNGMNLWIDSEACRAMDRLVGTMDTFGTSGQFQARKMQGLNDQFQCTFNAITRCSLSERLFTTLDKFENEAVMSLSVELFDRDFNFDFYSPLRSMSEVQIDSTGAGFSGGGLLLTGGVSDGAVSSEEFLEDLPEEFKNEKFGPLSPATDVGEPDPIIASFEMGKEINLAMKEETINSTVHTAVMLLWDLGNAEGDSDQSLDLKNSQIRELGMGIPEIGSSICIDKNGEEVASDSFACFPFPLNLENTLGPSTIDYVDFDGDGIPGTPNDALVPLVLRNSMDPLGPATTRIVDVTPLGGWSPSGSTEPSAVIAEIELGLRRMPMAVYEEQVDDWSAETLKGTGVIKSWCEPDRFPGMNPTTCNEGKNMPIARFNASGRVFVTLLLSINDTGLIEAEAGVSSVEKANITDEANPMDMDITKTYLQFNVTENNTIVPDDELAAALQGGIEKLLPFYLFGNARDIRLQIPTMMPLANFCAEHPQVTDICDCVDDPEAEGCDLVETIEELWSDLDLEDFGVEGFTLLPPLVGVTGQTLGPVRYLTIGTGVEFDLTE